MYNDNKIDISLCHEVFKLQKLQRMLLVGLICCNVEQSAAYGAAFQFVSLVDSSVVRCTPFTKWQFLRFAVFVTVCHGANFGNFFQIKLVATSVKTQK